MRYIIIIVLLFCIRVADSQQLVPDVGMKLLSKEDEIFLASKDSVKFQLLLEKDSIYQTIGRYADGLAELQRADKYIYSGTSKILLHYRKMLDYFSAGQFNDCVLENLSFSDAKQIGKNKEFEAMRLFSLNQTEEWEKLKEEMILYIPENDTALIHQIRNSPNHYMGVSADACKRSSKWFPGLGMIKAGYVGKGTVSFLLQAAFTGFIVFNIYEGYYVMAFVSGYFPLRKFHTGGVILSGMLAERKNEERAKLLKQQYLLLISKVIEGM